MQSTPNLSISSSFCKGYCLSKSLLEDKTHPCCQAQRWGRGGGWGPWRRAARVSPGMYTCVASAKLTSDADTDPARIQLTCTSKRVTL